ncbi:hypothetical protein BX600DRAFT_485848 [Xylariales sp. PMI_506]|nr:hypothetical protein BX600DRAFT_485848 [Xylariales sp. PMI_506]
MLSSNSELLLVTSIIFTSLAFVAVALRMYTRLFLVGSAGADDYLIVASLIQFGLGTHFDTFTTDQLVKFLQALWATIPVYNLSLVLCKLSIIFQYRRIFATSLIRKVCNITIGVLFAYGCWTVIGSICMCIPIQYFWGDGQGYCMNREAFWFSNAALNIVSDLYILMIPVPLIRSLQVENRLKLVLALKPLLSALFPRIFGTMRSKSGSSGFPNNNKSGSHHLGSRPGQVRKETVVEQTFEMRDGHGRDSRDGSERNLVPW